MGVNIGARWCIDDMVLHRCMPITNNTPFLPTSNHPAIYDLLVNPVWCDRCQWLLIQIHLYLFYRMFFSAESLLFSSLLAVSLLNSVPFITVISYLRYLLVPVCNEKATIFAIIHALTCFQNEVACQMLYVHHLWKVYPYT